MSMVDDLNKKLQGIALKISEIESKTTKTDDDITAYKSLVADGKKTRADLDAAIEGTQFMQAMQAPDKKSSLVYQTQLTQELTDDKDKEQEQRAEEQKHKGAYKAAFESYIRYGLSGMADKDKKILRTGAIKMEGTKAVSEGVETAGGFTVPDDFQAEVLKKEPGLIGLVDAVRHQQTSRDVLVWPRINYTTDNKKTAAIGLTWTGEVPAAATTANVTDEVFGQVRIPVYVAMAGQLLSNSLVEDSAVNIMELTAELFRENLMQDLEAVFATGTGAGRPEGITINSTAQTNYVASTSASGLLQNGIVNTYWNLPAQYRKNAKWVMSSDTARQIALMQDSNGRYLWQASDMFGGGLGSVQSDGVVIMQPRLLGAPLIVSEQMPSVTTNAFPIVFGDLRGYIVAERVGMSVQVLRELYAETDQIKYLVRLRTGGMLAQDYKVKLTKCAAS